MMWHTHAVIGASSVMLLPFIQTDKDGNVAVLMAFAFIGALMPDLDAAESKIKHLKVVSIKPFVPLAVVIHRDFGHRGLWHSLYGWGLWTIMILPLSMRIGWLPVAALSVGYVSHLAGDAATKRGIPLLYPNRSKRYLLPKRFRIRTGAESEEVIFILFSVLIMSLLLERLEV
jgi:membrane-bound metal-dependent hydrolase YbcI (DUF457 family)